ncbi:DUF397 domain-containing protein [Actinopolyspora saharensis]|uniref:DUF397 domain-containing protein n=1 Tax=Actinopolyspora saharensis TaxID=995062 RepID=A0A1H1EL05_9ACTN|nr:DUF397 domain-containing protein [Actinopolyspora saharensis]SDQ89461.1 protein of unknown function [Actinopolyspora saharensis]
MTTNPVGWRKPIRSQHQTACVEIGRLGNGAAVRDTKNRAGGYFTTDRAQWRAFIEAVKTDRFA